MPPWQDPSSEHSQLALDEQISNLMEAIHAMQTRLDALDAAAKQKEAEFKLRETEAEKHHESLMALVSSLLP